MVKDDHAAVTLVKAPDDKEVTSLADCLCWVTREKGLTDVKVIDHSLSAKTKAGFSMMFLYFLKSFDV